MKTNTLSPFMITDAREACRVAAAQQEGSETAIKDATKDLALKEQTYRVELAKEIARQHSKGVAWTVCSDLARGDGRIAQLRFERDVAKGVLDAARQAAYRFGANRKDIGRFVDWSARIDLQSGGAGLDERVPPADSPAYQAPVPWLRALGRARQARLGEPPLHRHQERRVTTCANCPAPADELHHVVYRQELRRLSGDPDDTQNLVPLCRDCHEAHHQRRDPLATRVLPDSAFEFARGLMGAGMAYEYLTRRYVAGNDPRVAELLAEWEQAA